MRNGALLAAAADKGFDAVITVDQNTKHLQNPATLPVAVVVMRAVSNDIDELARLVPLVLEAFRTLRPRQLVEVPAEPR